MHINTRKKYGEVLTPTRLIDKRFLPDYHNIYPNGKTS